MPGSPVLSVVVVNWNTKTLLLDLLARLFDEPRVACEVLVVDNASSDGSADAARQAFPDARVLPQPENGGFAYGVNRGLEAARGRWVLLLNTDVELDWRELERFVTAAEKEPDAAVFGPRIVDEHGATQRSTWPRHLPRHYLPHALFLGRLVERAQPTGRADVDCVSGCVFLLRRDAVVAVGRFDERFCMYFEEADFCERVRRSGRRVRFLPEARFVHHGGLSAAQSAERTFVAFRESCLLYHAAWHGRTWTEYVRACLVLGHALRLFAWTALLVVGRDRRGRARLYRTALRRLLRPGLVGELSRRPRAC